jgi:hypothetical protein
MVFILPLVFTVVGLVLVDNRVLFPLLCYASALAWVAICFIGPWLTGPRPGCLGSVEAGVMLMLFFTLPIPATMIGLGTGSLFNHPWRGAMIGFAPTLAIQLAYLVVSCL